MNRLRSVVSSNFIRGVGVLASGTLLAQALPVVVTPLLARIYSPVEMGQFALFTAFLGVAMPLGSLQFSKAIVSAENKEDAKILFSLSMLLIPLTSIVLIGLFAALIRFDQLGFGELSLFVLVPAAISLLAHGAFTTYRYWTLRIGEFRVISGATVWQGVLRATAQVVLGLLRLGEYGMMFADSLARGAGVNQLRRSSIEVSWKTLTQHSWSGIIRVAGLYRRFPLISSPSILINTLALSAPVPLIALWFSTEESGQFSVAYRLMAAPMAVVGAAVGDVFHNQLAELARSKPQAARRLFLRVASVLSIGSLVLGLTVLAIPSSFWSVVLGDQWSQAGRLIVALVPWIMAQFVVAPVSQVVPVYQRHNIKLIYDVVGLVVVTLSLWMGHFYDWSLLQTILVLSCGQLISYGAYFVLLYISIPPSSKPKE